jgi:type II secretory pathway component GspD/PulD (secretin)
LTVSGTIASKKDRVGAQLTVTVGQAGQRRASSRQIVRLRTEVTVLPGQPTVLAVTPNGALVVQIGGRKPSPQGKRFSFEMRNKPWKDVLTWLTEVTGKPVITTFKPTGSFTFVGPPKKTYSIPEIIDSLNEGLLNSMTQKYCLIHRERSFTLVPADEKIDGSLLPRVSAEDLDKRGRTELVSVVLPLRSLPVEDLAPEIKKMLGPFGEVIALKKSNQLLLQDTAGNIRRIYQTIQGMEKPKDR